PPFPLRGNEHDAVRGVRPVDRGGGSVPQHRHALDVVWAEEIEGVATGGEPATLAGAEWHADDDVDGLAAGIHRGGAADPDRQAAARVIVVHDLHACHLALDEQLWADDAAGVELRVGHCRHGAGDIPNAL